MNSTGPNVSSHISHMISVAMSFSFPDLFRLSSLELWKLMLYLAELIGERGFLMLLFLGLFDKFNFPCESDQSDTVGID